MTAERSALLVGATGLVGGHCLHLLLASKAYSRIVAIGRRRVSLTHAKLKQFEVNFEAIPNDSEHFGVDDVYCCLGTTIAKAGSQQAFARVDRDYPQMIAERAAKQGAKQFLLVSSVGANPASGNFYLRTKGEAEQRIEELPFESIHIFRPSMLLGERSEFRWKERLFEPAMRATAWMLVGALSKYRPIEAADVARAMLAAAEFGSTGVNIYEGARLFRLAGQ